MGFRAMHVDVMLQPDPAEHRGAERKVEEAFVGNCENDKKRRKCKENYNKSMNIVVVRLQPMQKRNSQGCNCVWLVGK